MVDAERMKSTERVRGLGYRFSHIKKISTHAVEDEQVGVLVYEGDSPPDVDYLKCALGEIALDLAWYVNDRMAERSPVPQTFPISTFRGELVCNARLYDRPVFLKQPSHVGTIFSVDKGKQIYISVDPHNVSTNGPHELVLYNWQEITSGILEDYVSVFRKRG